MYCNNCGNEIAEGAKFCSHCGNPVAATPQSAIPVGQTKQETYKEISPGTEQSFHQTQKSVNTFEPEESTRKPIFEEFNWNVSDYPDRDTPAKTEDIDFNWNADPRDIPDRPIRREAPKADVSGVDLHSGAGKEPETLQGADLEDAIFGQSAQKQTSEPLSAAERIDKFYTFNKKNEEFQQLLNEEYHKVKSGNAIEKELSQAEQLTQERFASRPQDSSMEAFLEREGIVKPYQPKEFESDVLQKIEAQEAQREAKKQEEEARIAAMEQARLEAETKKRAEEEARLKAKEEARLRAEQEARHRMEEEARLKSEAEARVRAAEEARLRAEADLKAAQEAAKIRAQQEARLAAEAEAQFKAEQERKRIADIEAQRRLEETRNRISSEANEAAVQEEARKALEQTARMRKEEEAKIRAAVAGIRSGNALEPEATAGTVGTDVVREAHQATKNQIDEMAKARDAYFAELEPAQPVQPVQSGLEHQPEATPSRPVTGRDTLLSEIDLGRTRVVDKQAILAGLEDATRVVSKEPIVPETMSHAEPIDFKKDNNAVDDIDDLLSQFESVNDIEQEPEALEFAGDPILAEDSMLAAETPEENPGLNDTVVMPHNSKLDEVPANDFDSYGNEEAANYLNRQVQQDTEPDAMDDFYSDDFYDDDESQMSKKELKQRAREQKQLEKERAKTAKAKSKSGKKHGDAGFDSFDEKEKPEGSGKGRIALKILLVVLIIILAVEVVGVGIKFIAPQSKAAELIDTQLNKVIQLVTGEDTQYSVIAAQVRTEPVEDKTDLITAQKDKNKNGNIKSIVYSADLGYDQERDGKVSDLVLSQPMTQVEWGRDKDNYPVYYDEQVVGEIIAFESQKVNLMNKGDEKVLKLIDAGSKLYQQTAALKNQAMSGTFDKLEIGEIRQAGSNYYIWVRETIGGSTVEKVYSMYPEKKFVMKMLVSYEV